MTSTSVKGERRAQFWAGVAVVKERRKRIDNHLMPWIVGRGGEYFTSREARSVVPGIGPGVEAWGGLIEIMEERGTEPAFHVGVLHAVIVAAEFLADPVEAFLVAGEGRGREGEAKAFAGIGDVGDELVDHLGDAGDERLADEADGRIIEDPGALVP